MSTSIDYDDMLEDLVKDLPDDVVMELRELQDEGYTTSEALAKLQEWGVL